MQNNPFRGNTIGRTLEEIQQEKEDGFVTIQYRMSTVRRLKMYTGRYLDNDCADDVINELIDTAEKHKTNCL